MDISSIITQVNDPLVVAVDVDTVEISTHKDINNERSSGQSNQNNTVSSAQSDNTQGAEVSSTAQEDSTKPESAAPATATAASAATVVAVPPSSERSKPRLLQQLLCCFCLDRRSSARRNQRQQQQQQQHSQHHRYHHNGGQTFAIDLLGPRDPSLADRICAVIDLDETLVHSSFKYVDDPDFIIDVEIEGLMHQVYVLKRPFTDEFLERMGQLFECVLFTASLAKYADPVSDRLDRWSAFKYRLFRESCVFHGENFVKDLAQLGRPVDRCVIIDNSPASYMFNTENAIRVRTWIGDQSDTELRDLLPYMERLATAPSVSEFIRDNPPPFTSLPLPPPQQQLQQQREQSSVDESASVGDNGDISAVIYGAPHHNETVVASEIGDIGEAVASANAVKMDDIKPTIVEVSDATS